jgi:hypothetical protein
MQLRTRLAASAHEAQLQAYADQLLAETAAERLRAERMAAERDRLQAIQSSADIYPDYVPPAGYVRGRGGRVERVEHERQTAGDGLRLTRYEVRGIARDVAVKAQGRESTYSDKVRRHLRQRMRRQLIRDVQADFSTS